MAAPMIDSTPRTPFRVYSSTNICCLCSFSFVVKEIDLEGNAKIKKLFKLKLKLNKERREAIEQVVDIQESADGVCVKCYSKVEKVLKYRTEIHTIINTFEYNKRKTPRRGSSVKKGLRSPQTSAPDSKILISTKFRPILPRPTYPQGEKPVLECISDKPVKKSLSFNEPGFCPIITGDETSERERPEKPVRKSLSFYEQGSCPSTGDNPSLCDHGDEPDGRDTNSLCFRKFNFFSLVNFILSTDVLGKENKISINYPSGKRTRLVKGEIYERICKAIFRSDDIKVFISILASTNPEEVVDAAAKVISEESKELCKRTSHSTLQEKDHKSLMSFSWERLDKDFRTYCPNSLKIVTSIVSDIAVKPEDKKFMNILHTLASGLHGRSPEMSGLHYCISFILIHGGCTLRDIDRLAKIGLCVSSSSVQNKLRSWKDSLDEEVLELKLKWEQGGRKYQLVGDNWDKNILPSFRTSQHHTISLHLFNTIAVVDRIVPSSVPEVAEVASENDVNPADFIPSVAEQQTLMEELVFIVASSVIQNIPQMNSSCTQYPLGLTDCNENHTAEVIKLLKMFQEKYVPMKDNEIIESVFFGGDRLTDERIQGAQQAMLNSDTGPKRLEGFISKIEDFHRLMNLLEAIARLTYNTDSGADKCTMYYFRNKLNARNVKGEVRNAYRAYKLLYYTVLDALCCVLFLKEFNISKFDDDVPLADDFDNYTNEEKIEWINKICKNLLKKNFFNDGDDLMSKLREVISDQNILKLLDFKY